MLTNTVPFSDKSTRDVEKPGRKTTKAKHESANDSNKSCAIRIRTKERMPDPWESAAFLVDFRKQWCTEDDFSKSTL